MARNVKKTDQNKPWNRRTERSKVYTLESRNPNIKQFLIICEGQNTEPYYFRSFPVVTARVETYGLGRSKTSLVNYVSMLVQQESMDSEREVWIVFDMDFDLKKDKVLQHGDFNEAIRLCELQGFKAAYSNDAFELWFLLHYQFLESALTRQDYYQRLNQFWELSYERDGKGIEFCRSIYERLLEDPNADQQAAIRYATRLHQQQLAAAPSEQNPCTTVYKLVAELNKYLRK